MGLLTKALARNPNLSIAVLGVVLANVATQITNFESFWMTLFPTIMLIVGMCMSWTAFGMWLSDPKKFTVIADFAWLLSAAVGAALAFSLIFAERAAETTEKYWTLLDGDIQREADVLRPKFKAACPVGYPIESPCNSLRIALDEQADRWLRHRQAYRFLTRYELDLPHVDVELVAYARRIEHMSRSSQAKLGSFINVVRDQKTIGQLVIVFLVALRLAKSVVELLQATGLGRWLIRTKDVEVLAPKDA